MPDHSSHSQSSLIAACLLASVLLHLLIALGLPGWHRTAPDRPAAALDVMLMPEAAPPLPAQPAGAPPAQTRTAQPRPAPAVPGLPAIAVAPAAERATPSFSAPAAEPAVAAVREAPRPPAAAPAAAPRAESALVPPSFTAAYLRNPPPRYPPAARRNGDEGTVLLRVLVAADGAAVKVELDRSSGSALLDNAALEAVRGWRFVPARRGQQNIEDWVRVPVVFRLEA